MHHFFEAITNKKGDALSGYFVRVIDPSTDDVVAIYADNAGTPILSVSEVANMAVVDSDGNASFYVASGSYHLDIYAQDAATLIRRVENVPMIDTVGDAAAAVAAAEAASIYGEGILFDTAATRTIPSAATLLRCSGNTEEGDDGAGRTFVEAAEVTESFAAANPLISFVDLAGRGFREIDARTGEKIEPFVLVISGQSNAVGSNTGGPNPASPGVQTWDGATSAWGGSDYTAVPWSRSSPDGNGGNNNYALAAAHRIHTETRRPVYIVYDAVGGTSIDEWVATGTASARYAALKTKVEAALASVELSSHSITAIDAMIWAQGEEDAPDGFSTHMTNLATLNTQLRAESWVEDYTPIYVTGMSDLHERYEVSAALRQFARVTPGWRFVSNEGQPTSDNTHFTAVALWDTGYNILGAMMLSKESRSAMPFNPFYNRGAGRLTQADANAIATFSHFVSWGSRTGGPGLTDEFVGDGSTTAFTLTVRSTTPFTVTVNGVAKTSPADYSIATTGTALPVITFTSAPANTAAIVVTYPQAVNGPASIDAQSWGYRCYADGNYTFAGGYLTYTSGACNYTMLYGRELTASDSADYSAAHGFQIDLTNLYQFACGRGHTLAGSSEFACGTYSGYTDGTRRFQVGIGANSGARRNAIGVNAAQGNVEIYAPSTAAEPGNTSELTFKLTTNTNLQIRVKGTDGTVRAGNITLA